MTIINDSELENIKNYFETSLKSKINPCKHCKAKLKTGKQCSHKAEEGFITCKKHRETTNFVRDKKHILYHDHLPYETSSTCILCNS